MSPAKQNNVFIEFEKFTRFQRIIGMSALTYSRGKLRVSRKRFVINLLSTSIILFLNFITVNSARKSVLYISKWYYYLSNLNYMLVTLAIVAMWVQTNRNVDLLNRSLFKMREADVLINSLGGKMPLTKQSRMQICVYLLFFAAYLIRTMIVPSFSFFVILLIIYLPFLLVISIHDNIDRVGSLFRLRFSALNQHLIRCSGMEAKRRSPVLEKLVLCHHYLCDSSEDMDRYQSLQLISLMASSFVSSFSEVFAVISILHKNEAMPNKSMTLTLKAFWLIIILSMFPRISHMFQAISTETKEFNALLYQIMIGDKTNEILNNQKLKLHIAMNREVVFTAYGFFNLDHSLVHSIIASSTTYLVILLQFSQEPS